jgi:bacterioferritin (cytochrome b1)
MKKSPPNSIVDDLNRLMAEELEAGLRYFQMRYRLKGADRLAAKDFFDKAQAETFEHADAIAQRIRALGQMPRIRVNLTVTGGPTSLPEALAEMLEVEQQALDAYKDLLPAVSGDVVLEEFLRQQIAVETEHVQEIQALLG